MTLYSHSRLSTFENCPRQYYYQYVARLPVEDEEGIEAFLGTLVHESLEKLYRDVMHGKRPTRDELVGYFKSEWKRRFHKGILVVNKEYTPANYRDVGIRALEKYHARHAPFDQSDTLALEARVLIKLDPKGKYRVQGYIDRMAKRPDGVLEIHDYKTNSRLPTQEEKDDDRQLALYQLGVEGRWMDIRGVELVWHFLRFDQEIRSTRTPEALETLRRETIELIDTIEKLGDGESAFEPHESRLCDWCAYQHVCPVRKHLFTTTALPANKFLKEPGVRLVNHWTTIRTEIQAHKAEIAALEAQEQQIIEALIELSQRDEASVFRGSDREAVVASKTAAQLPTKGDEPEAYTDLERRLRRSKDWPEVSMMDVALLRRIWIGEAEDPGRVRKMMEPFVKEATAFQVRLRKLMER